MRAKVGGFVEVMPRDAENPVRMRVREGFLSLVVARRASP
jgi:hypothetical protein